MEVKQNGFPNDFAKMSRSNMVKPIIFNLSNIIQLYLIFLILSNYN
jgi:hypothetical protein